MSGFGETLRQERESRGYTLESLSEATKVGLPLLEALEANDFARLPGGPFNHGFVRAIARTLDLDPELVVEAYDDEARRQGIRTPDPAVTAAPPPPRVEIRTEEGRRLLVVEWSLARTGLIVAAVLMGVALIFITVAILGMDNATSRVATESDTPSRPTTTSAAERQASGAAQVADQSAATPTEAEPPPLAAPPPVAASPAVTTPPPEQTPAVPSSDPSGLRVSDAAIGTSVVRNELRGETDRFAEGDQVFFWTRVLGGQDGDRLQHVWKRDGRVVHTQDIDIGGSHWRAYSGKRMRPGSAGEWTVEARDDAGRVLSTASFTCTGPR